MSPKRPNETQKPHSEKRTSRDLARPCQVRKTRIEDLSLEEIHYSLSFSYVFGLYGHKD
jgi:hypothetical protein